MNAQKVQYRVVFTIEGIDFNTTGSTKWFDTVDEAKTSKWMSEPNAKIDSRVYTKKTFRPRKSE